MTANAFVWYAKSHTDRPDIALPAFHRGAKIFPMHASFRDAPAWYSIFSQSHGLMTSTEALDEIENALLSNPNSSYLRLHEARLRGMKP